MIAEGREQAEHFEMSPPPTWAETWHLWTVLMPRRSISGKLFLDGYGGVEAAGGGNTRNLSSISTGRDRISWIRRLNERQKITHRSPGHHVEGGSLAVILVARSATRWLRL